MGRAKSASGLWCLATSNEVDASPKTYQVDGMPKAFGFEERMGYLNYLHEKRTWVWSPRSADLGLQDFLKSDGS